MRYDERDTIFSRLALKEESKEYEEYYKNNPQNLEIDRNLRKNKKNISGLKEGLSDQQFAVENMVQEALKNAKLLNRSALETEVSPKKRELSAEEFTKLIKEILRLNGIDTVGITKVEEKDLYSFRGVNKFDNTKYGEKITKRFKYAIVFLAPMEKDYVNRAPNRELTFSALLSYVKTSEAAAKLIKYIKSLGYEAVNDDFFSYLTPISFLAEKAGLGQMGRCNAVVNPKYGNRTKIAAVHTDLPLIVDSPIDFGLNDFCEICGLCEKNCPSKAISKDASFNANGKKYWEHNTEACTKMWLNIGSGCGICASACPFSQGVNLELISSMKNNKEVMSKILEEHSKKYGKRNFLKEPLNFMPSKK